MSPSPRRDRLRPWIRSIEARAQALAPDVRGTADVLVEQLSAIAERDIDRLHGTIADDLLVRVWGWTMGGRWTFEGAEALDAVATLLSRWGDLVCTMRGDIDRFFPGEGVVGMDGVGSWIRAVDGADAQLVSRRFAWFGTYRDNKLAVVDVYCDIHEQLGVDDRV